MEILLGPELGSLKFQLHPVIFPEEIVVMSLKQVGFPKQTVGAVKFANGSGFTTTKITSESLQPDELVDRRETE